MIQGHRAAYLGGLAAATAAGAAGAIVYANRARRVRTAASRPALPSGSAAAERVAGRGVDMGAFPTSVDEITPAWLAEAIGLARGGADIEQIGVGIGVSSALYRVRLTGAGCPETVVVKLPALDEESVFTSTMLRMYIREAGFFAELAAPGAGAGPRVPPRRRRPRDEPVRARDGGPRWPPRASTRSRAWQIADAERAVDGLAAWHATWWGQALELAERGVTVSLGDPIYKAVLPMVFAEGWEKLGTELDDPGRHPGGRPRLDRRHARPARRPRHRADHDDPRRLPRRQPPLRARRLGGGARLPAHRHRPGHLRPGLLRHPEPRPGRRRRSTSGPCSTAGAPAVEAGRRRPRTTPPPGTTTARPPCSASCTPSWPGAGMDAGDPRQVDLATTMLDRFDRAVAELDLAELL